MIEEILNFYEKTKLEKKKQEDSIKAEAPKGFAHVFHKDYPRLGTIPLPELNQKDGELESLLYSRKSSREFNCEPLDLLDLSKVLDSIKMLKKDGDFERRTYPSGGARFPVEIYPIIFNVNGLEKGVYHYNFNKKALEVLWKEDLTGRSDDFVSTAIKNPAAAIFFTAVLSRSEVKYGPKALGYSMIEAGHIAQNMILSSEKYKIGSCAVGGFIDDEVIGALDLVKDEIPIYALALGKTNEK